MQIRNQKDFWAGVVFVVIGLTFAVMGAQYELGTLTTMGPGYFPVILGVILAAFGILTGWTGISAGATIEKISRVDWRALVFILVPAALFSVLIEKAGLIVSLLVLVLATSYAGPEFKWREAIPNTIAVTIFCVLVFVYALKLQFSLWPTL